MQSPQHPKHRLVAGMVGGAALLGMVAAFGTAPDTETARLAQRQVIEALPLPVLGDVAATGGDVTHDERVQAGDSVARLLGRLGVDDPAALEFLRNEKAAHPIFRQLSPGKNVSAKVGAGGTLVSLSFPLNGGRDTALVVERSDRGYTVAERPLTLDTQIVVRSAEIRHSLFGASDAAGIPDSVATQLADIFGGDIDFHRDIRKGDRFAVTYEASYHLGRLVRAGKILAAEFTNNGKTFRAVRFEGAGSPGDDRGGYYTPDGKSIRKAFLRSPLEFSRVTSGFTSARFHPVLQTWRAHRGIDYGAPTGTRVKATGSGTVELVGTQGGYGKVVILRHAGGYSTLYGHLSGFAPGLRKGSRVAQGDVIGQVGATGLASGPHLHYEFRINNIHQNPLAVVLPPAPPLQAGQLEQFRTDSAVHLARIDKVRDLLVAQVD